MCCWIYLGITASTRAMDLTTPQGTYNQYLISIWRTSASRGLPKLPCTCNPQSIHKRPSHTGTSNLDSSTYREFHETAALAGILGIYRHQKSIHDNGALSKIMQQSIEVIPEYYLSKAPIISGPGTRR